MYYVYNNSTPANHTSSSAKRVTKRPNSPPFAVFEGDFKWLRSVKAVDGDGNEAIYGLPCHADSVLKIVPATGEVKTFGDLGGQMWKYHGGNLAEGR